MDFWSRNGLVIWLDHHKMENFILIHIPNLLLGFNIWCNTKWGTYMRNRLFENLNRLIISNFWMDKIWPYSHKSIWVAIWFVFQKICSKIIFFESFRWVIILKNFVSFFFRTFKFKNDISYIKYKFSRRFWKVWRWLNMYYSNIRIIIFLKVKTMSIWIILKNLVWTYKECKFCQYWNTQSCIHPCSNNKVIWCGFGGII
jgi:hypothetical protein